MDDDGEVYLGVGSTTQLDSRRYKARKIKIGFVHYGEPGRGIEAADTSGNSVRGKAKARLGSKPERGKALPRKRTNANAGGHGNRSSSGTRGRK